MLYTSIVLAGISAIFVPPSREYASYVDVRTLLILFSLMSVIEALRGLGVLDAAGLWLLSRCSRLLALVYILVFASFFGAMLVTNDVALITLVPLVFSTMRRLGLNRLIAPVIVMMTIAANMGSMLTPIGNPQNLYLYGLGRLSLAEFFRSTSPTVLLSGIVLAVGAYFLTRCHAGFADDAIAQAWAGSEKQSWRVLPLAVCTALFLLNVAMVVLEAELQYVVITAVISALCVSVINTSALKRVDYSLLLTFVALFVFIGNISRIDAFRDAMGFLVTGNEVWAAILSSQLISNVPAALLLSGFTDNVPALLVGVNIGGLGTPIASMASVISYRLFSSFRPRELGHYLAIFAIYNLVGLAILLIAVLLAPALFLPHG